LDPQHTLLLSGTFSEDCTSISAKNLDPQYISLLPGTFSEVCTAISARDLDPQEDCTSISARDLDPHYILLPGTFFKDCTSTSARDLDPHYTLLPGTFFSAEDCTSIREDCTSISARDLDPQYILLPGTFFSARDLDPHYTLLPGTFFSAEDCTSISARDLDPQYILLPGTFFSARDSDPHYILLPGTSVFSTERCTPEDWPPGLEGGRLSDGGCWPGGGQDVCTESQRQLGDESWQPTHCSGSRWLFGPQQAGRAGSRIPGSLPKMVVNEHSRKGGGRNCSSDHDLQNSQASNSNQEPEEIRSRRLICSGPVFNCQQGVSPAEEWTSPREFPREKCLQGAQADAVHPGFDILKQVEKRKQRQPNRDKSTLLIVITKAKHIHIARENDMVHKSDTMSFSPSSARDLDPHYILLPGMCRLSQCFVLRETLLPGIGFICAEFSFMQWTLEVHKSFCRNHCHDSSSSAKKGLANNLKNSTMIQKQTLKTKTANPGEALKMKGNREWLAVAPSSGESGSKDGNRNKSVLVME
jgi:hypothetical protein